MEHVSQVVCKKGNRGVLIRKIKEINSRGGDLKYYCQDGEYGMEITISGSKDSVAEFNKWYFQNQHLAVTL